MKKQNKIFSSTEQYELIKQNSNSKFKERNIALIFGASIWGLTRTELSLLQLKHLMDKSGKIFSEWELPDTISFNGSTRNLYTPEDGITVIDNYVNWLVSKSINTTDSIDYRSLDPEMYFYITDRYQKFKITKRTTKSTKGASLFQSRSMDAKLKKFIVTAKIPNATPKTFRDTWIFQMYYSGCELQKLLEASGYNSYTSIKNKLTPMKRDIKSVYKAILIESKIYQREDNETQNI